MDILDLPCEIMIHIISFLSPLDLMQSVRQTCRLWHTYSYDRSLWLSLNLAVSPIKEKITDSSFLTLLSGVCDIVERIQFGFSTFDDETYIHEGIFCPNLRHFDFVGSVLRVEVMQKLLKKYPQVRGLVYAIDDVEEFANFLLIVNGLQFLETLSLINVPYSESVFCDETKNNLNKLLTSVFENCTSLKKVELNTSIVGDSAISVLLQKHPNLEELHIIKCNVLTADAFIGVKGKLENLVKLSIYDTSLDDRSLEVISKHWPNLKCISLDVGKMVTDIGLSHIASNCPQLRNLTLNKDDPGSQCNITNYGLKLVVEYCQGIEYVSISNCTEINNVGIISLAEKSCHLRSIDLSDCTALTDNAIIALSKHCPFLTSVKLTKCVQLMATGINFLVTNSRNLVELFLDVCHRLCQLNFDTFSHFHDSRVHNGVKGGQKNDTSVCKESDHVLHFTDGEEKSFFATKIYVESMVQDGSKNGLMNSKPVDKRTETLHLPMVETEVFILESQIIENNCESKLTVKKTENIVVVQSGSDIVQSGLELVQPSSEAPQDLESTDSNLITKSIEPLKVYHTQESVLNEISFSHHSHLRHLSLEFCSKIENDSLKQIATHCLDLLVLSLKGCSKVTDHGLGYVVKGCQRLKKLNISGGSLLQPSQLTNVTLDLISKHCKSLEVLELCLNYFITDDGFCRFIEECQNNCTVTISEGQNFKVRYVAISEALKKKQNKLIKVIRGHSKLSISFYERNGAYCEENFLPY
ncbi:hypothetical protein CHS0354_019681 [Potamilus streckersoni]|uniref:F-box domain-containing protein n=1 Tax=Potamilus streckersoni TaxID=2493646 RepID=A0AAE0SAI2_9BIVA|nr:hypothetical protein CHS0354_019681 [Potamilus streckersoni]